MSTIPNEGGGGHIIQDEGSSLTARAKLNFKGAGVTAADNAGAGATDVTIDAGGTGTVTDVSVTTANGVSGTVATSTTTPAITLSLGAITPSSVNGVTLSGSSSPTLAVTGTTTVSGANTGDASGHSGLQPLNTNLTSISGLATTVGLVKQTSANTFGLDTNTYLTTETDPVVKAINGIVKSNTTTISAAIADTDYATPTLAKQLGVDINRYGFLNRSQTSLSFDGTDTLTLADTSGGTGWSYYRAGLKYTITGNKTKQLASPMVDGTLYFIYIDGTDGALSVGTGAGAWTLNDTKVPVATVYWNSTLTPKYVKCDERHTCLIDRTWHREHHFVEGTQASVYGTVSGLTAGSDTPSTKTFGITGTTIYDEDIRMVLSDITDPDGATAVYPILYRTSATTYAWVLSDMPFKYTTSAGPVYGYGEYDLNGTSTPAGSSQFFNSYIYATTAVAGSEANPEISTGALRYVIMQGRGVYSTSALALAEQFLVSAGMPTAEGVCLYQLTWATTNRPDTVKGRCRFVSIQQVKANNITTSVITATAHNGLSGLDGGTTNEYYHLTSAEYTPTATTGSGNMARLTSPQFTTPNIGTPSGGTLTSCTGLPIAGLVTSTSTAIGVGSIELGHASDTTIARVSAGVASIEGNNIIVSGGALGTPASGTLTNCTFPTLNQNTSGTAANLSGTPALPNGTTATTQAASDNSTKLATTAYADAAAATVGGGWTHSSGRVNPTTNTDSVIVGEGTAVGTSGTKVLAINVGTNPSTSPADMIQLYSADVTDAEATGGTITRSGGKTIHTFLRADTGTNFVVPTGGLTVDYLICGGGGGGGNGGGGGGAVRTATGQALTAGNYAVTVGLGGTGQTAGQSNTTAGGNSVFNSVTAAGGGYGGGYTGSGSALNGGCGGGAGGSDTATTTGGSGSTGGNNGGGNGGYKAAGYAGGGGGGAGAAGSNASANAVGGNGGDGVASSISGSSYYYGGGGGGSTYTTPSTGAGTGGQGGGGGGSTTTNGTAGTNNYGGGGGGARVATYNGGNGGNGVVIISYTTPSSYAELRVRDEKGNVTTLSPHNTQNMPKERIDSNKVASDDMAWTFHAEKGDKSITIDMFKAVQTLERLSGVQLIFSKNANITNSEETFAEQWKKEKDKP